MTTDKPMIAISTKQSTYFSRLVVVVNRETDGKLFGGFKANCAFAVLSCQEFVVLFWRDAVSSSKVSCTAILNHDP